MFFLDSQQQQYYQPQQSYTANSQTFQKQVCFYFIRNYFL